MSFFIPSKTKFRKHHQKSLLYGKAVGKSRTELDKGVAGLKSVDTEPKACTGNTLEAIRRVITRHCKKQAKTWMRIFPDIVVTSKPAETRQGSGKGSPEYFAASVKPGTIIVEVGGLLPLNTIVEALELARYKLPFKTKVVTIREDII